MSEPLPICVDQQVASHQQKIFNDKNASLEIVLKIQETCNINCSYCYMYNLGNEVFKLMPEQRASLRTCVDVGNFVAREIALREPAYVRIIIHGGEPMLIKASAMEDRLTGLWSALHSNLSAIQLERVELAMHVRRQNIWRNSRRRLAECRPRLGD
jgi:sulfatase maturation enzyme AslB (radical SAM superfamily)